MSEWSYRKKMKRASEEACEYIFLYDEERWEKLKGDIHESESPLKTLWTALDSWEKEALARAAGIEYGTLRNAQGGRCSISREVAERLEYLTRRVISADQI